MDGQTSLRERKKRRTYQAISDAAIGLFLEQGFDQVSVAEVAAAAMVSKPTLFRYFPAKEDLALYRFADHEDEASRVVRERTADQAPLTALHAHFRAGLDRRDPVTGLCDDSRVLAFHRLLYGTPSLVARLYEYTTRAEDALARTLYEVARDPGSAASAGAPSRTGGEAECRNPSFDELPDELPDGLPGGPADTRATSTSTAAPDGAGDTVAAQLAEAGRAARPSRTAQPSRTAGASHIARLGYVTGEGQAAAPGPAAESEAGAAGDRPRTPGQDAARDRIPTPVVKARQGLASMEEGSGLEALTARLAASQIIAAQRILALENWRRIADGESADAVYPAAVVAADHAFAVLGSGLSPHY
ncbi:AcrR family transcriptional regulator [Streptomyces zagrosensis]|uniref:AcrR family transcriptional regulator n=1 Tax=Streptomyces zagrosensis TaxID=1042984 RepID=A0A7W9UXD6_9ACTN|nr:AcrR family transcriptional regulator [Streptomyces zagrosensis]